DGGPVGPRLLRRRVQHRVHAAERHPRAELEPAREQLLLDAQLEDAEPPSPAAEAADVRARERDASEAEREDVREALPELAPRREVVSRPDRGALLDAAEARARQQEGPLVRPMEREGPLARLGHLVRVQVAEAAVRSLGVVNVLG